MTRHAKLAVAAVAAVVATTLGTVGVATSVDAGNNDRIVQRGNHSWCC
jgi:hypothetical protein